jgi:phage/conjugal plasmid C-4 type zinc finger TraR family protein
MAGGWSKDGAIQDQIDASIEDAVKQVREKSPKGESLLHCEDCGETIPEARRQAIKGVRRCVACQELADKEDSHQSLFNRRGSKDSQLR